MDKHPHIIGRQIFDIDFSSKENSGVLQDKISSIFNNFLIDEMNQLFDRILPSNRIIKVDTLQINLGDISFDHLDTELPNRLIQKIEEELRLILLHDNSVSTNDSEELIHGSIPVQYLQLLEYFLLKGTYPWWVSEKEGPTISVVLEFLLLNASLKLKELILRIGRDYNARKRLVYQFTEQQIKYIIIILEPEEAEFIFDYHQNLVQVQREIILVKNEENDFRRAVWLLILSFLIIDRGSHFNRKEFVKMMLINMSAHFNTEFKELLALFAAGLQSGSPELRNIDSLQSIILELSIDVETNPDRNIIIANRNVGNDLPELSDNLELLRYFLTFGSFPWWAVYSDKQSLEQTLMIMLNTKPKTMAVLLRNIGQKQYSRRLIVKSFNEEVLLAIIKILEPEQVEFIADYVTEAKENNKKDSIIKVQTLELNEAIWEFVLEYLLVDRGSDFNRQMFLESNIRNLANRFNVNFSELLVFLVQNIGVRHYASNRHISLIRDLTALYEIRVEKSEKTLSIEILNKIKQQAPEIIESKSLRDILYYWLKLGHYPWWAAEKYSNSAISQLIEQLFRESPAEAIVFIKFAGQSLGTRTRILNQVSNTLLFKIFRLLPDGNKAVRYIDRIISIFTGNTSTPFLEQNMMERITLASLWDMYIKTYYESFKPADFLTSFMINLSFSKDLSINNLKLFLNSLVLDQQIRTQINKVIRYLEENGFRTSLDSAGNLLPSWSKLPEIELIITQQLRSDDPKNELLNFDMVINEASFILRYFLQFNKLPSKYKQSSEVSVNSFLKQLLLFLHKNNPADLDRIIFSEKYDVQNVFRLYDIFRLSNSIEENVIKVFLAAKFEKNILLLIRQKSGIGLNENNLIQLLENLTRNQIPENKNILRLLLKSTSVSSYLAQFLSDSFVHEMLELEITNTTQVSEEIRDLNNWLSSIINDSLDKENIKLFIRSFNLMLLGGIINAETINSYFILFMEFLNDNNYQLSLKIRLSIRQHLKSSLVNNGLIIKLIPELEKFVSRSEIFESKFKDLKDELKLAERKAFEKLLNLNPEDSKEDELRQLKEEIQEQQQDEHKKSAKEILSDQDSIYIHNAGLVILHPFLSTYFNRLNMIKDGDFINSEFRHRAVHLLQYLAFGTEKNEEHELVLNKILCNIPIDEPIISEIVMTELEKTVSAELLNAVLVQWDKLKNTSAESFQASFMQRDGALSRIEENWNLKVETRGYDVLLNTLPWGLGMIKTPWMTEFIYVEWM
jgi:hypothetical protein